MPLSVGEVVLVANTQKFLQQPPSCQHYQTQQQKPADDPVLSTLDFEFDIGQGRSQRRYKKGYENTEAKAIIEKGNKFLLLQMMCADWFTFGVNREILLRSLLASTNVL